MSGVGSLPWVDLKVGQSSVGRSFSLCSNFAPAHLVGRTHFVLKFSTLAILISVRWSLRVVLVCISLMAEDVGHFVKCTSDIALSPESSV